MPLTLALNVNILTIKMVQRHNKQKSSVSFTAGLWHFHKDYDSSTPILDSPFQQGCEWCSAPLQQIDPTLRLKNIDPLNTAKIYMCKISQHK